MSAKAMKKMAKKVGAMLPEEFGYVILVFPFHDVGTANYISNAQRPDMIKALREAANRLDKKEDFETPQNNIY